MPTYPDQSQFFAINPNEPNVHITTSIETVGDAIYQVMDTPIQLLGHNCNFSIVLRADASLFSRKPNVGMNKGTLAYQPSYSEELENTGEVAYYKYGFNILFPENTTSDTVNYTVTFSITDGESIGVMLLKFAQLTINNFTHFNWVTSAYTVNRDSPIFYQEFIIDLSNGLEHAKEVNTYSADNNDDKIYISPSKFNIQPNDDPWLVNIEPSLREPTKGNGYVFTFKVPENNSTPVHIIDEYLTQEVSGKIIRLRFYLIGVSTDDSNLIKFDYSKIDPMIPQNRGLTKDLLSTIVYNPSKSHAKYGLISHRFNFISNLENIIAVPAISYKTRPNPNLYYQQKYNSLNVNTPHAEYTIVNQATSGLLDFLKFIFPNFPNSTYSPEKVYFEYGWLLFGTMYNPDTIIRERVSYETTFIYPNFKAYELYITSEYICDNSSKAVRLNFNIIVEDKYKDYLKFNILPLGKRAGTGPNNEVSSCIQITPKRYTGTYEPLTIPIRLVQDYTQRELIFNLTLQYNRNELRLSKNKLTWASSIYYTLNYDISEDITHVDTIYVDCYTDNQPSSYSVDTHLITETDYYGNEVNLALIVEVVDTRTISMGYLERIHKWVNKLVYVSRDTGTYTAVMTISVPAAESIFSLDGYSNLFSYKYAYELNFDYNDLVAKNISVISESTYLNTPLYWYPGDDLGENKLWDEEELTVSPDSYEGNGVLTIVPAKINYSPNEIINLVNVTQHIPNAPKQKTLYLKIIQRPAVWNLELADTSLNPLWFTEFVGVTKTIVVTSNFNNSTPAYIRVYPNDNYNEYFDYSVTSNNDEFTITLNPKMIYTGKLNIVQYCEIDGTLYEGKSVQITLDIIYSGISNWDFNSDFNNDFLTQQ